MTTRRAFIGKTTAVTGLTGLAFVGCDDVLDPERYAMQRSPIDTVSPLGVSRHGSGHGFLVEANDPGSQIAVDPIGNVLAVLEELHARQPA